MDHFSEKVQKSNKLCVQHLKGLLIVNFNRICSKWDFTASIPALAQVSSHALTQNTPFLFLTDSITQSAQQSRCLRLHHQNLQLSSCHLTNIYRSRHCRTILSNVYTRMRCSIISAHSHILKD